MPRHIAFLRAINVGGRIVKMAALRTIFEELGFQNVETLIASGNILFDSPSKSASALERKIEDGLRDALGYEVATFIRSPKELAGILERQPFPKKELDADGNDLFIAFLAEKPSAEARSKALALQTDADCFEIAERELYWLRKKGLTDKPFSAAKLEKALGMPITVRNATTVRKLAGGGR